MKETRAVSDAAPNLKILSDVAMDNSRKMIFHYLAITSYRSHTISIAFQIFGLSHKVANRIRPTLSTVRVESSDFDS